MTRVDGVRQAVVEQLIADIGPALDAADDEWMVAHVALRAVQWVLDAAGLGPDNPAYADLWRRLDQTDTVAALADLHWRFAMGMDPDDDDDEWPLSFDGYVRFIEQVLAVELGTLTVASTGWSSGAVSRFGAPLDPDAVASIGMRTTEFSGRFEPEYWFIQSRVGGRAPDPDPTPELDRFIAHWSYRRIPRNPWHEVRRGDAITIIATLRRTSLVWGPTGKPTLAQASERAAEFLSCFDRDARFFTNGCRFRNERLESWSFRITDAMFDAGVVAIDRRHAGIWWHAEGDRDTPLGMSP